MRALCGAIITAGALIGLGLTALGFGVRFMGMNLTREESRHPQIGTTAMTYLLVFIGIGLAIGLGIAFLGLMFHHERRHRELSREPGHLPGSRATV
jgi:hypothetical protein